MALLPMYDAALAAGVPLGPKDAPRSADDFAVSPALISSFNAYVRVASDMASGTHLEARLLTNRKLYLAWRFKHIRQRAGTARPDAALIQGEEQRYAAERVQLDMDIAAAAQEPGRLQAQQVLADAEAERSNANANYFALTRKDWADAAQMQAALKRKQDAEAHVAQAKKDFADADDHRLRLEARKSTLGGAGLVGNMDVYDRNLLLDVEAIQKVQKLYPRARLRPHYMNLLEAYDAEFVMGRGLLDDHTDVLSFFDKYVHDSLAGFAKDETLPSDPRVVYVGGDTEAQYASNNPGSVGAIPV